MQLQPMVGTLVKFTEENNPLNTKLNTKAAFYIPLMLIMPLLVEAGTVQLIPATPGNNNLFPASSPSPTFSGLILNFANLESQITALGPPNAANCEGLGTNCPTFSPSQYASQGVTISSPDSLLIYPFSDQTAGGIELFDPGASNGPTCPSTGNCDGTANITVTLASAVANLAIGLSDFDNPVNATINVLGQGGTVLFSDTTDVTADLEAAANALTGTGQTYFAAEDTIPEIYGIQITQTIQTDGSGLALAEVEATPEPSTLLLMIGGGLAMIGVSRLRRKA
jgi:hypothetical protein